MSLTAHPTKSGPSRKHGHKVAHSRARIRRKGAPFGFKQRINPNKPPSRRDKHRSNVRLAAQVAVGFV